MKIKEFNIILDIKKQSGNEPFEVVQGDTQSNLVNILLVDGLDPYDLTGTNIEIIFSKADGTTVQQTMGPDGHVVIINELEGKMQCTLKTNTTAIPGKVIAEVRILSDETLLTSARFDFYVRKSLINDETIESTNEFPVLTQLIVETNGLIEQVNQIEKQVPENVVQNIDNLELGKINKTDIIHTDTISDPTKVPSSAVTEALGKEIDVITNNLAPLLLGLHPIKNVGHSGTGATLSHTMSMDDFNSEGLALKNTGTYLLLTTSWGTAPSTGLYLVSYSGGSITNSTLTTIAAQTGGTIDVTSGVINVSGMARIRLYAFS